VLDEVGGEALEAGGEGPHLVVGEPGGLHLGPDEDLDRGRADDPLAASEDAPQAARAERDDGYPGVPRDEEEAVAKGRMRPFCVRRPSGKPRMETRRRTRSATCSATRARWLLSPWVTPIPLARRSSQP